jgi:hypothetical protein
VTSNGFFSGLLEVFDSIFCGRDGGIRKNMRDASRFISHHEEEWGGITGVVFSMIVKKSCHRKVLNPIKRCKAAINAEIGF